MLRGISCQFFARINLGYASPDREDYEDMERIGFSQGYVPAFWWGMFRPDCEIVEVANGFELRQTKNLAIQSLRSFATSASELLPRYSPQMEQLAALHERLKALPSESVVTLLLQDSEPVARDIDAPFNMDERESIRELIELGLMFAQNLRGSIPLAEAEPYVQVLANENMLALMGSTQDPNIKYVE